MKQHAVLIISFFIIFTVLGGCSSGGGGPVIPDIPLDTSPVVPESRIRDTNEESSTPFGGMLGGSGELEGEFTYGTSEGHYMLMLYDVTFDPKTGEVTAIQQRSGQKHWNATDYVLPPECSDCLKFQVIDHNSVTHIYTVKVTLKNPTPIKAYDVRGIAFIGKDSFGRELVNADNYTTIYDTHHPPHKNPYKGFKVGAPKRVFNPDETDSVNFEMKFPPPPKFNLQFAIDISWPKNMKDPYDITNQTVNGTLDTTGDQEATIRCDVYDWQDDLENVSVDLSALGGGAGEVAMENESGTTYAVAVTNTYGAGDGVYTCEISAKSLDNTMLLFDYVDILVVHNENEPPVWFGEVVGIDAVIPMDEACEISYGVALDINEPVVYNIYCSEEPNIDFETVIPEVDSDGSTYIYGNLINGQTYYFAVRAKDGLGLEDDNVNELPGTPESLNFPPEWVDEEGVTGVFSHGPGQMSVYYGEAVDPDEPVTYTVYYSDDIFEFDWETADKIEGNTGSPTVVAELELDVFYMFGVRARDDLGLEDANEVLMGGMTSNLPPFWDEIPGGILEANPGDGEVEVVFGTATDPDSVGGDVVYNVYYSTEVFDEEADFGLAASIEGQPGSPVDVGPLPNGIPFYFVVRAEDEFGLEEKNMIQLSAAGENQPPMWDGPVGVQNLIPGNQQVTVEYGTASDPDTPVTYNIYYSEFEEDFWLFASVLEEQPGSPTVIEGLFNDIPIYVAVRARDSSGLIEGNEVIMSATPSYDNQPPTWDDTVGIQEIIPGDKEVIVVYGTASDPDMPLIYNIYCATTTPIDFVMAEKIPTFEGSPTVVAPLINGQTYYFAVRAEDGFGLEEDNTVELPGVAVNSPPVWDDTVGIVDVQANDEYALVYFGTASDPSVPVVYNVYWDTQTPIDFDTCESSLGKDSSPAFIGNLTNGQQYWFAVRAEDGEGLEDENTNELPAMPMEQPPTWDTTIGIQDAIPGDHQVTVVYGTASDLDVPVTYNVYYSQDTPINFGTADKLEAQPGSPTIVDSLTNDQVYYFAVKARDATGLEDANTVELSATPTYDNSPPEWQGSPAGIQNAVPGDHQVTVIYGTAWDTDLPVTYNIYWSTESPINYVTASKKIGEIGSPTIVDELTNDQPYFFAVRAMDGLGMEDTNTNELEAVPMNEPPIWDTTEGITGVVPDDTEVTVEYGTAGDPDTPVTYTVYYSTESLIDFEIADKIEYEPGSPTVVGSLINEVEYHFAVRARDGLGLEDENIIEMPATPSSGNTPPVWDTTIGITDLSPMSQAFEVEYGTASDPDVPVTYRIYYEEGAPLDWDTSPYITDTGSPSLLEGLNNASVYSVGVRAVDDLGLEEENEVTLLESPNLPPEWPGGVGIIEAIGMYGKAEISFNEAEDTDGLTYNLYYSKLSPMNFGLADKITGITESPFTIEGLDKGEVYYFAVRAVDDLGYEESNIVEASAEIWAAPQTKWIQPTGELILSSPNWLDVNADGQDDVIIGGFDQRMKALSAIDGSYEWSYVTPDIIASSPCLVDVNGGVLDVAFGSGDGNVYAVDGDTGVYLWSFPACGPVDSSPASGDVDNDGDADVVVGSFDFSVYVIDAATGVEVWHQPTGGGILSSPALYDVTGDDKLEVFVGSDDGWMYCFNGDGSGEIWHYSTSQPIMSDPVIGDVEGDGDKECLFVSDDGFLYVVDAATGAFRWNFELTGGTYAGPVLGDVNEDGAADVAIGKTDGTFYLIDGFTHTELWSSTYSVSPYDTAACLVDMTGEGILDVVIGNSDGNLYCFDGTNGELVFIIPTFDSITCTPMIHDIDNDMLLEIVFGTSTGDVYAIDTERPIPGTSDIIWPKFLRTIDNRGVL